MMFFKGMEEYQKNQTATPAPSSEWDHSFFQAALLLLYVLCPLTVLSLQFLTAPYGRHYRSGWGPSIPAPIAWFLMESPTLWLTAAVFPHGRRRSHPLALFSLFLFILHYINRTLIYPLRLYLSSNQSNRFPIPIAISAFLFNLLNSYLQSRSLSHYSNSDLVIGRVLIGAVVFAFGMKINIESDEILRRLKGEGKGYRIPKGKWFELVSCPNYLGEVVEWIGWAVVAWSPAAAGFFLYTCSNLVPRARAHHRWYREKFAGEYPEKRTTIVPFVY